MIMSSGLATLLRAAPKAARARALGLGPTKCPAPALGLGPGPANNPPALLGFCPANGLGTMPAASDQGQPQPHARDRERRRRQQQHRRQSRKCGCGVACGSVLVGMAVVTLSKRQEPLDALQDDLGPEPDDDVLDLVDRLSDWARADEANKALTKFGASRHPEVLWRQGRVQYLLAQSIKADPRAAGGDRGRDHDRLVRDGYASLQLAVQLDPSCGRAFQWHSVLRYAQAELDGSLARLKSVDLIREDMERAVHLLPADGVIRTMLGMWFHEVSQLSWVERQVVRAAGQTVPSPEQSLRQAQHWFLEAERVQPGRSCLNQLMLGKTVLALEGPEQAVVYLESAARIAPSSASDAQAQLEARQLLETVKTTEAARQPPAASSSS